MFALAKAEASNVAYGTDLLAFEYTAETLGTVLDDLEVMFFGYIQYGLHVAYNAVEMHYDYTRRYGFKEISIPHRNMHFKTGTTASYDGRRKADDLKAKPGISGRFNTFHPGDKSSVLSNDEKVTDAVIDFMKNRKADEKPFFALAGYIAPHWPLVVPQRYWDQYKGKVPMPVIPKGHLDSLALNNKHLRIAFNVEDVPEGELTPAHIRYRPILHFTERDIWDTTLYFDIPYCPLYEEGYRSLGAKTTSLKSNDIAAWEQDLETTEERAGRRQDKEKTMERLRMLGYM